MSDALGPTLLWQGEGAITADIWFVHGLRGGSLKTWTQGDVCWPRDLLKQDIASSRIYTWGYDSSVLKVTKPSSQASIVGHSENLLNDVAETRDDDWTRPLIFVCHSLGGLVVKEPLIRSSEHFHNKQNREIGAIYHSCKGVVFLGTPHRGSAKTSLGELVSHIAKFALQNPNNKLVNALREDSDVLERQRKSFTTIADKIPLACIYEELPTAIGLIVEEHSASIDGRNVRTVSIPVDHMGMCKFDDRSGIAYKRVIRFIKSFVREAVEVMEEVVSEHVQKQTNELFESLAFSEMHDREKQITEAHQKTYQWLFDERDDMGHPVRQEQSRFRNWLSSDVSLFWMSGKPASGKSTLMKYVYNHTRTEEFLSKWASGSNLVMAGFFFLERSQSMLQKSRQGLLRALSYQLLIQLPDHIRFSVLGQFVPKLQRRRGSLLSHSWPLQDLQRLLTTILQQASSELKIFLLIDGLDEYRSLADPATFQYSSVEDDEQSPRGNGIKLGHIHLAESSVKMSSIPHIKICVSSRPLNAFRHEFESHVSLRLENLTRDDISNYVSSRLSNRERFLSYYAQSPSHQKEAIVSEITEKACGVFLWVKLVLDNIIVAIDDYSLDSIQTILLQTPTELKGPDGLYMKMLQSLDPSNLARGARLFRLMVHANHRLSVFGLWCVEKAESLGAIFGTDQYMSLHDIFQHEREMEGRLASCTAGLLETVPTTQKDDHRYLCDYIQQTSHVLVQFIHQSAKEFLEDQLCHTDSLGIREVSPNDPYVSLLIGSISQLACLGINLRIDDFYAPIERIFIYARYAEQSIHLPMSLYLQCLDRIVSKALKCWGAPQFLEHRNDKDARRSRMILSVTKEHNNNWPALFRGGSTILYDMCQNGDDLCCMMFRENLMLSLRAELEQGYQVTQKKGRPLLDYILVGCPYYHPDFLADQSRVPMVELLLKHGATPNALYMDFLDGGNCIPDEILLERFEQYGIAPYVTFFPDCKNIDSIWTRYMLSACYNILADLLYDRAFTPRKDWIDVAQLLVEHSASIAGTVPSPVGMVDVLGQGSKVERLSWPYSLSALFVASLVSYSSYGGEESLVRLMYSKGARLVKGEKTLLEEALKIDDKTLSEWIPEVFQCAEVENHGIEHGHNQTGVREGSEDCMKVNSWQVSQLTEASTFLKKRKRAVSRSGTRDTE